MSRPRGCTSLISIPSCVCCFACARGGNTLIIIEHNLDVIKCADHVIDMGPGGGIHGGRVVAQGTPEEVSRNKASATGRFLREVLCNG